MNHNFGLHLGITTHLEKIYGAPSFESWCDIKTKVKGGKKLGINYYPQSHMYLLMQQVKVWGFRNTANNYHGCRSKFILLKAVCSKKKEKKKEKKKRKTSSRRSVLYTRQGYLISPLCMSLCPVRLSFLEGMSISAISGTSQGPHISISHERTGLWTNSFTE